MDKERDISAIVLDCVYSGRNLLEKDSKRYCLVPEYRCPYQKDSDKRIPFCVNELFGAYSSPMK